MVGSKSWSVDPSLPTKVLASFFSGLFKVSSVVAPTRDPSTQEAEREARAWRVLWQLGLPCESSGGGGGGGEKPVQHKIPSLNCLLRDHLTYFKSF